LNIICSYVLLASLSSRLPRRHWQIIALYVYKHFAN
jgi:hypothetical protein